MAQQTFVALDPAQNPAEANAIVASALDEGTETPPPALPDPTVKLPSGGVAEVREMNGEDEEHIARLGANASVYKQFSEILRRCVITINHNPPQLAETDGLLVADTEALLLAVRIATYGNEVELRELYCTHCDRKFDVAVELDKDVPYKEMKDPGKKEYTVPLRKGEAEVRLPIGADRLDAFSPDRTLSEQNTVVLSRCLLKLDGAPVIDKKNTALKMGIKDRQTIMEFLSETQPGPQLGEVEVPCSNCGEKTPVALDMAFLFRAV